MHKYLIVKVPKIVIGSGKYEVLGGRTNPEAGIYMNFSLYVNTWNELREIEHIPFRELWGPDGITEETQRKRFNEFITTIAAPNISKYMYNSYLLSTGSYPEHEPTFETLCPWAANDPDRHGDDSLTIDDLFNFLLINGLTRAQEFELRDEETMRASADFDFRAMIVDPIDDGSLNLFCDGLVKGLESLIS